MKRLIVSAASAAALAAPAAALAQSSVTISGFFKASLENVRLGDTAKSPSSETRISDDASRLIFAVTEDLGGGLAAIGQVDLRPRLDDGGTPNSLASGNTFAGLRSKSWGQATFGRHDLHYTAGRSEITSKAGSYKADNLSLLAFAGGGSKAIAIGVRTTNVLRYDSPLWGGFAFTAAYSTNAAANEADIGSAARKGSAWVLTPSYMAADWQVIWSHWNSKPDAFASGDEQADRLGGSYTWRGFRVGLTWDRSQLKDGATGMVTSKRTAWSLPLRYAFGRHSFYADYTKARDDKATAATDGASMFALAYGYDFSKRTSVGVSYAGIRNDAGAAYNLFGSAGAQGSASGAVAAGEDPRIWAFTLRHAF